MILQCILDAVLLLVFANYVCCDSGNSPMKMIPLWKSLLTHHRLWSGYYIHDNSRFMSSMSVHSVDYADQGTSSITFTTEGFQIEMDGYSDEDENEIIIFKESHIWNKSGHFEGHTDVRFRGEFVQDFGYYKYLANVSSQVEQNFGIVTLIPQGRSWKGSNKPRSKAFSLGLAIGVPLLLGIIVLSLAIFIMVWAVRKGYLRHVPWTYKTFNNPKKLISDVEMDASEHRAQTVVVEGVQTSAVHM